MSNKAPVSKSSLPKKTVMDEDFFPIMGWNPPRGEHVFNERILREMVAAGFTIHQAHVDTLDECKRILDLDHKVGLRTMLVNEAFSVQGDFKLTAENTKRIEKIVKEVKNHPALYGYHLRDEPFYQELKEIYKVSELIRSIDDYHLAYVNHFPPCQTGYGAGSMEVYYRNFICDGRPMVLSYDHYCILSCSDDDIKQKSAYAFNYYPEDKVFVRPAFYEALELVRRFSVDFGIPMWAFCCSQRHGSYPHPTEGYMRFMLMHALAYGARGLLYFTYQNYGLLDFNYQPTPTYYIAKQINSEIHALAPVLRSLTSIAVYHWGPPWHGTFGIWPDGGPNSFSVEGDPVTIGCFVDDEGLPYFMVCNKNPCSVSTGIMRIVSGENDHYYLDPVRKEAYKVWPYTRGVVFWHLQPGEAKLYRVGGKAAPFPGLSFEDHTH